MSETDEIIGSAEPMESEMLSDNLQLIVGSREYLYSHRELFLSPAPVSVYGIKGPIAVGTLLKLWEQGDGWLCVKCDECGEDACIYSFAGNPMTGTTSVSYQCCHCGASRQHVRTGNFIDRARTLAAAVDQYQHGQDDVEGIPFEKLITLLKESHVRIV